MAGWDKARDEIRSEQDQARADKNRFEEAAQDMEYRLVRAISPRVLQFVQTLHDHNQWPMASQEITEKKTIEVTKGLLRRRVPQTRFEKKTVTKPSSVEFEWSLLAQTPAGYEIWRSAPSLQKCKVIVHSNSEWMLLRRIPADGERWDLTDTEDTLFKSDNEAQATNHKLVTWVEPQTGGGRYTQPTIDLEALNQGLMRLMVEYLIERDLPLPSD